MCPGLFFTGKRESNENGHIPSYDVTWTDADGSITLGNWVDIKAVMAEGPDVAAASYCPITA